MDILKEKRDIMKWLEHNCSFFTCEGNTAVSIYKGRGYEVRGHRDAIRVLYDKILYNNYDFYNPKVNYMTYVPHLEER